MKKTWITILSLTACMGALAQGQVNFNTHVPSEGIDSRFLSPAGFVWTEGFGQLAILDNKTGSLTPLLPIAAFGKSAPEAGYINAGIATAPTGFPGGTVVSIVLRGWAWWLGKHP